MSGPWEKYSGAGDDAAPVLASKDRRMQKTISDIEAGVPAAPLHWRGEPLETSAPAAGPWMQYAGEKPRGLSGDNTREEPGTGLDDWGPGGENKPGFWEEFSKNIIPTQKDFAEGMLGRTVSGLAERAKTAIFGEKTLAQIAAEGKPIRYEQARSPSKLSVGESFVELGKAAVENPGKTTAELLKSIIVDPEVFLLPNLGLPAKASQIAARGGRVAAKAGQMAGAGAELGLKGAALETAAQLAPEEQPADWQAPLHVGAMWAIPGAALGGFGKSAYKGKAKPAEAPGEAPREPGEPEMGAPEGPGPFDPNAPGAKIWEKKYKEQRAERLARKFMWEGASIKTVEAAIKRDPLVGEKLAEMRRRREDAAAAFDRDFGVRQGEVLPPEGGGLEPARAGRTFEEPKEPTPTAIARRQGGAADPRLLAGLAAAGLTYAAFQDMLPVEQDQVLMGLGLAGTVAIAPKSSLGVLREQGRYSTKVLNRLPDNRTEFKKAQIEQELRRPDVGKEERELLTRILRDTPGDTISANDLMTKFRLETGDHTLTPKPTGQYGDFGLPNIGRSAAEIAQASGEIPTTYLWRLPEHMELPVLRRETPGGTVLRSNRHFDDPRYFAHTREFVVDGITHVVELQSDLVSAMGAKRIAKDAEYVAELRKVFAEVEAAAREARTRYAKIDATPARGGPEWIEAARRKKETFEAWQSVKKRLKQAEAGDKVAALSPVVKNWERRVIRETLRKAADRQRAKEREADQWARELTALPEDTLGWHAAVDAYSKAASEAELGKVIRFADADTVARVEGWREHSTDPGRFADLGHQSIYDRYKRDITKYLKSLGGKEVTDQHGHGWIEVPLEKFKGPVEMYGKADPRLLAGLAAAGITVAAFLQMDDEQKREVLQGLGVAGLAGITFGRGKGGVEAALKKAAKMEARAKQAAVAERVKEVETIIGQSLDNISAQARIINTEVRAAERALPDAASREIVAEALDNGTWGQLSGPLKDTAQKLRRSFDAIGRRAVEAGVLDGLRENYITHVVDWKNVKPSAIAELVDNLIGRSEQLTGSSNRFARSRKYDTFEALQAALKESGLELKTKEAPEIYRIYANAMERAIQNRRMVDSIKGMKNSEGKPFLQKVSEKKPPPRGWKYVDSPQLRGYAVDPEIYPQLKFVFGQTEPGLFLKAAHGLSQLTKRLNVVGSLFHAKSLTEASWSAVGPVKTLKDLSLAAVDKFAGTKSSGITKALEAFRQGKLGDEVDQLMRAGLQLEIPEDVTNGILAQTGKVVDELLAHVGPKTSAAEKALGTVEKYTLGVFDRFTWDYLHTGLKLNTAMHLLEKAKRDNPTVPEAELMKTIASHVNDTFGGLNWFQAAAESQSKFFKDITMAAYSKNGRMAMQVAMFAPDWTLSTLRAFTSALKFGQGAGWRGLLKPRTKADFARRYQARTALTYLTLINGVQLALTGKPLWENEDFTRVEFGDGTSMQPMKHAAEPYHWGTSPMKTLSNKIGFIPKSAVIAMTGQAYVGPTAPRLEDQSSLGRAKAIASQAAPFQVQAAVGAPKGEGMKRAALGTLGFPVYGTQKSQVRAAALKRARERAQKRKERREALN